MKVETEKLDINKLTNVPTGLSNLNCSCRSKKTKWYSDGRSCSKPNIQGTKYKSKLISKNPVASILTQENQ